MKTVRYATNLANPNNRDRLTRRSVDEDIVQQSIAFEHTFASKQALAGSRVDNNDCNSDRQHRILRSVLQRHSDVVSSRRYSRGQAGWALLILILPSHYADAKTLVGVRLILLRIDRFVILVIGIRHLDGHITIRALHRLVIVPLMANVALNNRFVRSNVVRRHVIHRWICTLIGWFLLGIPCSEGLVRRWICLISLISWVARTLPRRHCSSIRVVGSSTGG